MNHQQIWWAGVGCLRELYSLERLVKNYELNNLALPLTQRNLKMIRQTKEIRKRISRLIELASGCMN